jgi:hypothetical protein
MNLFHKNIYFWNFSDSLDENKKYFPIIIVVSKQKN